MVSSEKTQGFVFDMFTAVKWNVMTRSGMSDSKKQVYISVRFKVDYFLLFF